MEETTARGLTDQQLDFVVRGFVQVWNKFEDMLSRELATTSGLETSGAPESRMVANHELLFRVGIALGSNASLSMGELSDALSVPLSTATRLVNMLVGQGYVQRMADPDDRRVVRIGFTPVGQELFRFIDSRIVQRVRKIASHLEDNEMATLISLFAKIAGAVEETLN